MYRRHFVSAVGLTATVGVTGCLGDESDPEHTFDGERITPALSRGARSPPPELRLTVSMEGDEPDFLLIGGDHRFEHDPILVAEPAEEIKLYEDHLELDGTLKVTGVDIDLETETEDGFDVAPDHGVPIPDPDPEIVPEEIPGAVEIVSDEDVGVAYVFVEF